MSARSTRASHSIYTSIAVCSMVSLSGCVSLSDPAVSASATDRAPAEGSPGAGNGVDSIVTASDGGAVLAAPSVSYSGGITGVVGIPISSVSPVNNGGLIANCTVTPHLPAVTGLTFDATTCAVTGTPTQALSLTTFTITATNATGTSTATFAAQISGSVAALVFDTEPAGAVATGAAFSTQPVVRVIDSGSNALAGVTVTLTAYTDSACSTAFLGSGAMSGASANTNSAGIATFTAASYTKAQTIFLKATAGGVSACSGGSVVVLPGSISQLVFSTAPSNSSNTDSTLAQQPVIALRDAYSNTVTSSADSITLKGYSDAICSVEVANSIAATANPVTASSGVATFSGVRILKTSVVRIGASSGAHSICSDAISVAPGAVSTLAFSTQPSATTAADAVLAQQPVITLKDANDNTVTTSSAPITLAAYSDAGCTTAVASGLSAASNPVAAAAGVATFSNVGLHKTNVIRIGASDGTTTACSSAVAVSAGAASKVVFTVSPSNSAYANIPLSTQPIVHIQDAHSNAVNSAAVVTLSAFLTSDCSTTAASGTLSSATATASGGTATFSGLKHSSSETIYLKASSGSLTTACTSNSVAVTATPVLAPPTTDMALWLKADALSLSSGDLVSSWTDSSSIANHATTSGASRPSYVTNVINGKPVIRFGGSQYLKIADHASLRPTSITVFSVFKRNSASGAWAKLIQRPYYSNSAWNAPFSSWGIEARNDASTAVGFYTSSSGGAYNPAVSTGISDNAFHVLSAIQNVAAKTVYSDGVSIYTGTSAGSIYSPNTGQQTWIAGSPNGEYLNGDIAEILVYSSALSSENRNLAECYLSQKYNLQTPACPHLAPTYSTRNVDSVFTLATTGGTAPYQYFITSGGGSIDSNGVFTAPHVAGTTTVQVIDANNAAGTGTIAFVDSANMIPQVAGLVFEIDAAAATTSLFPGVGCEVTSWWDVFAGYFSGTMTGFSSCGATTGWNGTGTTSDPYRLTFNGSSNYLTFPNFSGFDVSSAFSINAWVYPTSLSARMTLFSTMGASTAGSFGLEIGPGNGGTNRIGLITPGIWNAETVDNSVTANAWNHIVYTRGTDNAQKFYVNGTLKTLATTNFVAIAANTVTKLVGARTTTTQFLNGSLVQLGIYNRALTANQVARNCNALKTRFSGVSCPAYVPPTKLVLAGQTGVGASQCSRAMTVTATDSAGTASDVTSDTPITLSGTGSTSLFSNSTCTTSISTVTIPADSSVGTFYIQGGATPEDLALVASDSNGTLASSASHSFSVTADSDPYWSSVVLFANMDGTPNATSFTDQTGRIYTFGGTAKLSSTQVKNGVTSANLTAGSNTRLTTPQTADLAFRTGDFTVEVHARFNSFGSAGLLIGQNYYGADYGWGIYADGSKLYFNPGMVGSLEQAWSPAVNTWYHIAVTRSSGSLRFFVNGVQLGSAQSMTNDIILRSGPFCIGRIYNHDGQNVDAFIDDVRVTKGVARYTTSFTPPATGHRDY